MRLVFFFVSWLILNATLPVALRADQRYSRGLELINAGDYQAAVKSFEAANVEGASMAKSQHDLNRYNHGIALYRTERLDEAAEKFRSVAAADNAALAAMARYNLGNVFFRQATEFLAQQDPGLTANAIKKLTSAIEQYRSSLRLDPSDEDARVNIELASRLLDELDRSANQPPPKSPDQSDQSDQQQSQDDGEDQNANREGSSDEKSSNQPEGSDQASADSNSSRPKQTDSSKGSQAADESESPEQSESQQQSENEEQQAGAESSRESSAGERQTGTQQKGDAASDETPTAPQSDGTGQSASKNQNSAASPDDEQGFTPESEKLLDSNKRGDNEMAQERDANSDDSEQTGSAGELTTSNQDKNEIDAPPINSGLLEGTGSDQMTAQEAQKMLQAIRDRDMIRRIQKRASEADRRVPVDRDW